MSSQTVLNPYRHFIIGNINSFVAETLVLDFFIKCPLIFVCWFLQDIKRNSTSFQNVHYWCPIRAALVDQCLCKHFYWVGDRILVSATSNFQAKNVKMLTEWKHMLLCEYSYQVPHYTILVSTGLKNIFRPENLKFFFIHCFLCLHFLFYF